MAAGFGVGVPVGVIDVVIARRIGESASLRLIINMTH